MIKEKGDEKKGIEPKLVCEVQYLEMTENWELRAPSFQRLRNENPPEECALKSTEYFSK